MNTFVNYAIEANAGFLFFYGIFYLLLRNETDFRKQRIFLVSGLVGSLVFPFIHIQSGLAEPILLEGVNDLVVVLPELVVVGNTTANVSTPDLIVGIYLLVAIGIAIPFLLHILKLYRVSKSSGTYKGDYFVVESNSNDASWSFFRVIFIGRSDYLSAEEKDLVVKHEMLHGRLLHSADLLLITILCTLCWFNPILWVYRRTIARVHEYEVDSIVANENNPAEYGLLLAKTVLSGNGFLLTHHFNQSFILKRINMLNMLRSRISSWKLALLVTTLVTYFIAVSCTEPVSEKSETEADAQSAKVETPASVVGRLEELKAKYPSTEFAIMNVEMNANALKSVPEGKGIQYVSVADKNGRGYLIVENVAEKHGEVFNVVDNTALPPDGMDAFYKQLGSVLQYPEQARKMGIEGKVFVEFVVREDGRLSDFKVLKGIGAGCDVEALRALSKMENWNAGTFRGTQVAQKMVLPITFKLG